MNAPKLVYVTKIRTTPGKLWEALIQPEFVRQYWVGCHHVSTWQEGAPVECYSGEGKLKWNGEILKNVPGSELVFSFNHVGMDEPASRVSFKIERADADTMQLTITHDEFIEASPVRERVQGGWPIIVKGIKELLETGKVAEQECSCETAAAKA